LARLGVGAVTSDSASSFVKDASRLKGHILKKRKIPTTDYKTPAPDEEDESRAAAIQTRHKPDPFNTTSKKKKKAKRTNDPSAPNTLRDTSGRSTSHHFYQQVLSTSKSKPPPAEAAETDMSATDKEVSPQPSYPHNRSVRVADTFIIDRLDQGSNCSSEETDFNGIEDSLPIETEGQFIAFPPIGLV
jgi:hypothetical protein